MDNNKNNELGIMNQGDKYNPQDIEKKWQKIWNEEKLYATPANPSNKKYILDMFPYPSGSTLHVGHVEGYVGTDIIARFERMKGSSVLHPMGWDAFGLPAENFAIKSGIHPDKLTHDNIKVFKRQLNDIGLSYDWEREIDTSDPKYYKWTQWIFTLMFRRGLAYKRKANVNWCPNDETVLANEQVIDGKCERCDNPVVQKKLNQWFLRITDYADRLISGLEEIDWLPEVKIQQKNWIGKSEGALIEFKIEGTARQIKIFTTRPDTLWGATFMVISPEHPIVEALLESRSMNHESGIDSESDRIDIENLKIDKKQLEDLASYVESAKKKTENERTEDKQKSGVATGLYCINPVNGARLAVWVADYVLMGYGTGAIMAVPAHDTRDFEFAKKFELPIVEVIEGGDGSEAYTGSGKIINSGEWDGWETPDSITKVIEWLEEKSFGKKEANYHLRDWLISRQRYWGVPIPMIYCESCEKENKGEREDLPGWYTVQDSDLPVKLPTDVDFKPTGESPIVRSKSFQEGVVCPSCHSPAKREVDTMDTYVDSSWYFMRFVDPNNENELASTEALKTWLPVDIYIGGGHVVQHLLFARFFWKVLFDAGIIDKSCGDEPFLKLRAPGWILGPDTRKMSKRWKNVITPDDIIPKFGADTLRMYEMFMGPFDAMKPWSLSGVEGMSRFLARLWRLFNSNKIGEDDPQTLININQLVKDVTEDLEGMYFNTAIAKMMEFYNSTKDKQSISKDTISSYLKLLAPFAPHFTEEIWNQLRLGDHSIHKTDWPKYDEKYLIQDEVVIPIQVNGKRRGEIVVESSELRNEKLIGEKAKELIKAYLEGKEVKKVIYVPGKIINFVI